MTLAVVIVALAVGGVAYAHSKNTNTATATVPAAPNTHSVTVTFALHDLNTVNNGCVGTGGYSDIGPGTQAILSDQDGKVLGSGDLGPGDSDGVATCTYTATISNVPTDRDQYVVEVSHRGKIVNSHSEMVAAGWSFSLTMGS